jgi:hypothetical protein
MAAGMEVRVAKYKVLSGKQVEVLAFSSNSKTICLMQRAISTLVV